MNPTTAENRDSQRAYYQSRRPVTMLPVATPYASRHFAEAARAVDLRPGESVLELGSGMGRFAVQFAERGHPLVALELSPDLAGVCAEALAGRPQAEVRTGDALAPDADLQGRFDVVAGFFFLHHLPDLARCFAAVRRCLKPGGRFVFVEPNPWNPLYYLQITLTPTMRWRDERGILDMRPGPVGAAALAAGLRDVKTSRYGALPRAPYDALARRGWERAPEKITPPGMRPFSVFTGTAP